MPLISMTSGEIPIYHRQNHIYVSPPQSNAPTLLPFTSTLFTLSVCTSMQSSSISIYIMKPPCVYTLYIPLFSLMYTPLKHTSSIHWLPRPIYNNYYNNLELHAYLFHNALYVIILSLRKEYSLSFSFLSSSNYSLDSLVAWTVSEWPRPLSLLGSI